MSSKSLTFALFGNLYQQEKSAAIHQVLACLKVHGARVVIDEEYLHQTRYKGHNATILRNTQYPDGGQPAEGGYVDQGQPAPAPQPEPQPQAELQPESQPAPQTLPEPANQPESPAQTESSVPTMP